MLQIRSPSYVWPMRRSKRRSRSQSRRSGSGAQAAAAAAGFQQTGIEMEELRAHIAAQDACIAALEARLADQQQGSGV